MMLTFALLTCKVLIHPSHYVPLPPETDLVLSATDSSEYQYLRLIFNTSFLPPEYSSDSWQMALQDSITKSLVRVSHMLVQ